MSGIIVVGVSGRSGSPAALTWALAEAAYRGASVLAVRAWRPSVPSSTGTRPPLQTYDPDSAYAAEQQHLAAAVAGILGPDHGVECRVVHGGRRRVLLEAAQRADLLVLDAPRRSDFSVGSMLAHRLVHTSPCPVVIMPPALSGTVGTVGTGGS